MSHSQADANWYLVRTKPHKERWAYDQLKHVAGECFLPMLRSQTRCFGKLATTLKPLFPSYLFARFDLRSSYFEVKYAAGVQGLVTVGGEPVAVAATIIEEIRCRAGSDGVVEIPPRQFNRGQRIQIVDGPFRGIEAIFDRYLSGLARVAILLEAIGASGVRVVLPASCVAQ